MPRTNGKGLGPVATAMKHKPTDLTLLTLKNHGKYPDTHVVSVLQFGTEISGSRVRNDARVGTDSW